LSIPRIAVQLETAAASAMTHRLEAGRGDDLIPGSSAPVGSEVNSHDRGARSISSS